MQVDLMRKVDKWLGIPLCFFFTCFEYLARLFRSKVEKHSPERILFIELSEMGSIVLAYSLFRKAQTLYPKAELYFLTFAQNRYALDLLKVIPEENVFTIDSGSLKGFVFTYLQAIRDARKQKIDTILDMELFARVSTLISYLSGARSKVGYYRYHNEGLYRGELLTHRVEYNPQIHMAYNLLNLIYALDSHLQDIPLPKRPLSESDLLLPHFEATDEEKEKVLAKLDQAGGSDSSRKKLILLNPNASDMIPLRKWPLDNYIELARRLLENPQVRIVLTGTEAEKTKAEDIRNSLNSERCLNLAGLTTFSELMTLYSIADLLVTNDSGPVHFSSLTDIHSLALFGPETPKLYGPLGKNNHVFYADFSCSPCVSAFNHRKSPCQNNLCLQSIAVDEIFDRIQKILSEIN